ncbi:colorectal cancer-associated protein 2 [Neopelma chrysocephalum]|uniref:colorectal cancer-associated protein 2 n=1 Tax=Neopelma chrysocephalum TaxID=114329 RepID=UPI000FCD4D14|nr:colorectal cancer-associated protein 2 [Neopelma chrysocephalum]
MALGPGPGPPRLQHRVPGEVLPLPAQDVRVFPQTLSGKPKVYQGVRVKITVKELLQQRRARQAATGSAVSENILLFALSLLCLFSFFFFFFFFAKTVISGPKWLPKPECNREKTFSQRSKGVSWGSSSIQFSESVSPPHPAPFDAEPISSVPNCCPSWQFSNCLSCEESPSYLEQLIDSCLQSDAPSEPACSAFQPSHYTPDTFQPVPLCFNQGLPWDSRVPQCFPCPSTDCLDYLPPLAVAEDFFRRDRSWDICYS